MQGNAAADEIVLSATSPDNHFKLLYDAIGDKHCYMKAGYGRSPVNDGYLFGTFPVTNEPVAGAMTGPVIPGSDMSPSAYSTYFRQSYDPTGDPLTDTNSQEMVRLFPGHSRTRW